ncbi:hypothetical protein [Rhizobium leguminosarum]|uniref:hypothetical protein n=1 Tax=Rhizobium leguminosarum TaxID=384 RepID=UPI0013D9F5E7|nr:hypothetical protein [Rhizobium leguminosarum]NEI02417.1 hypothetical protein [Rhizobium leguminosarum]
MARRPAPPAFRPYLAPILLRSVGNVAGARLLTALVNEIVALIDIAGGPRVLLQSSPPIVNGALRTVAIEYQHRSEPAWAPPGTYTDLVHHLLVISVKGTLAAISTSEPAIRPRINRKVVAARPISRAEIESGFVGDEAKALWLDGIHARSDAKPDAKTLMGRALEFAIDPLGDQTYAFKAVRSKVPLVLSSGAASQVIGASPDEGRLWLNRPGSWLDFAADTETLLDKVDAVAAGPATVRFPALAQAVTDLATVSDADAVAVVPPELLAEDTDPILKERAARWAYGAEFVIAPGAGPNLVATVTLETTLLGDLSITPTLTGDKVALDLVWITQPAPAAAERADFDALMAEYDWLKIYYGSGHTISGGRCFRSAYTDQWFPDWKFKNLAGYNVTQEKPVVLPGQTLGGSIGTPKAPGQPDDSLFGYCHDIFDRGWLASDDGSMELADFVHIDDDTDLVTLIHAKGAASTAAAREVSASKYEVVTGQAVKNLRHLERQSLADVLDAGRHHLIADAVWHDGVRQPDRTGLIARVQALPANYRKRVVILQPQLTETEHDNCANGLATPTRTLKMKQLNTLLLAARLSANAVGADLEVWGEE